MAERVLPPVEPRPISRLLRPFAQFAKLEAAGGLLLLLATLAALFLANSRWAGVYEAILRLPIMVGIGNHNLNSSLRFWVNDGCMALFFLLVGLEIKREFLMGELSSPRRALLPLIAATGGVLIPAFIYIGLNHHRTTADGWGVPMATDIAFSLAILALFGKRVPTGLKVFLAAFAIADDIAGVVVIATAYTDQLQLAMLVVAGFCFVACLAANAAGVIKLPVYLSLGALLWLALLRSGVHATLAGLIVAMSVPARTFMHPEVFLDRGRVRLSEFERGAAGHSEPTPSMRESLHRLHLGLRLVESPLDRLEYKIHPWVSFCIVPLFAFANAGINFQGVRASDFYHPEFLGIYLGLLLGKPLGITLFSWLSVRTRLASLPSGVSWTQLHAVSWLGGIGFTISIFIGNLAFGDGEFYATARIGILLASLSAALMGSLFLNRTLPKAPVLETGE